MDRKDRHPLGDYMLAYVSRFNALRSSYGEADRISELYLRRIVQAVCYWASDGAVIFFFPEGSVDSESAGAYLYDRREETLTHVVQSYSDNLIKVTPTPTERLRPDLSNLPDLPPDLDRQDIRTGYINKDILAENWNSDIQVAGVSVAPIRSYEDGLLKDTLQTRFHLWSPTVQTPSGRDVRQYAWLGADFMWGDFDTLSGTVGDDAAEADLNVLQLGRAAGLEVEALTHDPFGSVADHIVKVCSWFESLIQKESVDEASVQQFLQDPAHQFLLSPVYKTIHPQKRLGGGRFVIDFAIQRVDSEW